MQSFFTIVSRILLTLWSVSLLVATQQALAAEPVRIGVLSFRPKPKTMEEWAPLTKVLKEAVPERDFVIEALNLPELEQAVASRQVDFVLTNSGNYVLLKRRYDLSSPLATLVANQNGQPTTAFGGVIFTKADAGHINSLADIKSKAVSAVSQDSTGGYQMQAYELSLLDIQAMKDLSIKFTGLPHDKVVKDVLSGVADVGFVRSGLLEEMSNEGKLDLNKVKVINRQNLPGFPTVVSTRLYPEWPFAAQAHIDEKLARHVTAALFLMGSSKVSGATRHSFVVPSDYAPIEDMLRELRAPPFDVMPKFTLNDIWDRYNLALLLGMAVLTVIFALSFRLLMVNRSLGIEQAKVLKQQGQLEASEVRFRTIVEQAPDAMLVHRMGKILYGNAAAIELFAARDLPQLRGIATSDLIQPQYRESQRQRAQLIADGAPREPMVEAGFLKLDGTPFDVEVQGTAIVFDEEPAIHVTIRDVTQRKQAQKQLHLAASVFSHAREAILIANAAGNIVDVNQAFTDITGYSREEVLGLNPRMLASGRQERDFYASLWKDLAEKGHWYGEVWNRRKDGEVFAVMQTISAVLSDQGKVEHYVALFSDITLLKEHQHQLERIAHFDALTQLPNRALMSDRLHQAMAQAMRRDQQLGLAFLDLDGFKAVNDTYGHAVGDQLLSGLAQRMKQVLRDGDTLARLGGDEFVAILVDLADAGACETLLGRLLQAASLPLQVGELTLVVSASIGVTFYPQGDDDVDADQLLRQADHAMYQAKQSGKNRYVAFDGSI
jgi:diguanylate cyclase (GGDEF)-like protein/PAS domain S-box-containing protein